MKDGRYPNVIFIVVSDSPVLFTTEDLICCHSTPGDAIVLMCHAVDQCCHSWPVGLLFFYPLLIIPLLDSCDPMQIAVGNFRQSVKTRKITQPVSNAVKRRLKPITLFCMQKQAGVPKIVPLVRCHKGSVALYTANFPSRQLTTSEPCQKLRLELSSQTNELS
jgi:hypothetical protein